MPQNPIAGVEQRTFNIDLCLGRGGFGEVYRARMRQPGGLTTTVALKVLLAGVAPESQPVERLRDEGRMLAQLEHPVIMRVIDITTLDSRVALVIEYIAGQDLSECCRGENPVSQAGLVHIIGEIASALDKAWSTRAENGQPLRLVHRNIKPSNIRIGKHGEVKLLDFGIARSDEMTREARTATQMVVGSLHYMAPERFTDRPLGPEADVFALGCCLFEGLSGQQLFARLAAPRVLALALEKDRFTKHVSQRKRALRDGTHPSLIALMDHCLAHKPEDRPTAAQLVALCDEVVSLVPGPALRSWARKRDWPPEGNENGPLVGMTFSDTLAISTIATPAVGKSKVWLEGPETIQPSSDQVNALLETHAPTATQQSEAVAPQNARKGLMFGGAVIGVAAMALASVLALGGVTWIWTGGPGDDHEAANPIEQPVDVAPTPDTEAPVEPALPAPDPVEKPDSPVTRPLPTPQPAPRVAPAPSPTPEPVEDAPSIAPSPTQPRAPKVGTLVIHGEQRVTLRGTNGEFGAGTVPIGNYVVWVDGGAGPQSSIRVEIVAGEQLSLLCNSLLTSCTVE